MPLITSTTALNKLKWGSDRFNAGITDGSNQPYIRRDIPGVNVNDPNPTLFNDDGNLPAKTGHDFLLRDGFMAPIEAARDVSRLTQMLFDTRTPNGFEFIAKQNLLSRTAVKTEASYGIGYGGTEVPDFINGTGGGAVNSGIYLPTSTLAQAAVGFTGTHLNLLGLDPTSPMSGVISSGLFPGAGLRSYFDTVSYKNQKERFQEREETYTEQIRNPEYEVAFQDIKLGTNSTLPPEFISVEKSRIVVDTLEFENRLVNLKNNKITKDGKRDNDSNIIIKYSGGPGSILGIGDTNIMFADQRTGFDNPLFVSDKSFFLGGIENRDKYNRSPETKIYTPKLGASRVAAGIFPNQSQSLATATSDNALQNINNAQSTIRNAELVDSGFFNPTGSNNYSIFKNTSQGVTSGSIDYLGPSKLGATTKAEEAFPDDKESLEAATTENALQNVNLQNNTIDNPELSTGLYAGFKNPTGDNDYSVFKNTSDGVTSGEINYERVKLPLLSALSASDSTTMPDEASIIEAQDTGSIQNQNTKQSTFRNAKIDAPQSGESFFSPDGPNNYGIFGTKNVELKKSQIFVEGSSVSYAFSNLFPSSLSTIFEGLSLEAPGGLDLYNQSVYEPGTLTTEGRGAGGQAWANNGYALTQAQIESQQLYSFNPTLKDFRKEIITSEEIEEVSSVLSLAPNYNLKSGAKRVNLGDPGKSNTVNGQKNVFNYGLPAKQTAALDKLTAMPMYESVRPNGSLAINDYAKFRIAAINNDSSDGSAVYMHFRAFIDSFSDNYNADWDPVKYSGRGESLYNYTGFNRSINMSFTCFAQSKAELIPMYKKLNYLASTLAPDYTGAGFMRGNLVKLTLGGYLHEQPGFISSLTYDIPQESPWEIAIDAEGGGDGSVKELPHMIKVSQMTFTPIHTFLPQKPNDPKTPEERFIALSNNSGQGNYLDTYQMQRADGDGDDDNSNNIVGE